MTTVEDDEMELFKSFAPLWWIEDGPVCGLHTLNKIRVPYVRDCLIAKEKCDQKDADSSQVLKNLLILDAGCGAGIMSESLAKLGCEVVGLDPCEDVIKVAKDHAGLNSELTNLDYTIGSVEDHCESNFEKYDCVISSEVLEHITKYEQYLEACVKCLKPGGSIIVTTFNKTFMGWFEGVFLYEYWYRVIPRGTHQWKKFVPLEDLERILTKYNCKLMGSCGMTWNVRRMQWKLTDDKRVTYGVHAIKMKP